MPRIGTCAQLLVQASAQRERALNARELRHRGWVIEHVQRRGLLCSSQVSQLQREAQRQGAKGQRPKVVKAQRPTQRQQQIQALALEAARVYAGARREREVVSEQVGAVID